MKQYNNRILWVFVLLALGNSSLWGQRYTIDGTVRDAATGEVLIGANIYLENSTVGTVTNLDGNYSLTLAKDSVSLIFVALGYKKRRFNFLLQRDTSLDVVLQLSLYPQDIEVLSSANKERVGSTKLGNERITAKEAKEIVALFGEPDMIKLLQLKPGIQSGNEGASGLYVRGGGVDQNQFILDDALIYNPNHFLGLFSVFNADITNYIELYKAGFPAQYGGRLSSVVDVRMRDGNRKKIKLQGGIGLITSRLSIEGPIVKDKGSFIIGGRATYIDAYMQAINAANVNNPTFNPLPSYGFYDLNAKLAYDISDKDRIFFSGYFGRDYFSISNSLFDFGLNWGNLAATIRWNRQVSSKLLSNTSLTFSDYVYEVNTEIGGLRIKLGSSIRDLNLKNSWLWVPSPKHNLRFGANLTYHYLAIGQFNASNSIDVDLKTGNFLHAGEGAVYFSEDWSLSQKIKILAGLRLTGFHNQNQFYGGIEPRLVLRYAIRPQLAFKASYTRMTQYMHLVTASSAILPADLWFPSNERVRPQISDMAAASFSLALGKDFYISVEGFYKWMHHQVDFKEGARLFVNNNLDQEFIFGRAYSYGGELYLEKKNGNLRGWIGYTLSWTWRQFDLINQGNPYHPGYDRRHDFTAVITWDIPWTRPKFPLTLMASWIYGTGSAISIPTKRYLQTDITYTNPFSFVPVYKERGNYRLPDYHRLDLGLIWKLFPQGQQRLKSDLTISVYNVYDRRNPFFMYIRPIYEASTTNSTAQIPDRFEARVVSLFPILPSITWNFRW